MSVPAAFRRVPHDTMNLAFRDIEKHFGDLRVVERFDRDVAPGELVALVGPSGCGKSTILHMAAGLEKPSHGQILADGKSISRPDPRRMLMFQENACTPG